MKTNTTETFQITTEPVDDISFVVVMGVYSFDFSEGIPTAIVELIFVNHVFLN